MIIINNNSTSKNKTKIIIQFKLRKSVVKIPDLLNIIINRK